jgi:hypothetical protein
MLLTEEGRLVDAKAAITVPRPVFDIWPADQAMALLDAKSRPALCQHVSAKNRTKLVHWGLVEEFSKDPICSSACVAIICRGPRPGGTC